MSTESVNEKTTLSDNPEEVSASSPPNKEAEPTSILSKYAYPKKPYIYLYFAVFFSLWGERTWNFAVPLILATIYHRTILPPATIAFLSTFTLSFTLSTTRRFVDNTNRLKVVRIGTILQNGTIFTSSLFLIFLNLYTATDTGVPSYQEIRFWLLFLTLILFMIIFSIVSHSLHYVLRDWILVLCNTHPNPNKRLSDTNRKIHRIDAICKLLAPIVFSVICYFLSIVHTCVIISLFFVFALVPSLMMYTKIYKEVPQLALPKADEAQYSYLSSFELSEIGEWRESETTQQRKDNTELGEITEKHESDIEDEFQTIPIESSTMSSSLTSTFSSFKETNVFVTIWRGWSLYFNQNVFLVSISFVLLFATLFVPGILLIAYMKTMSISDLEISVFYGLFSTFDSLAVFLVPQLLPKLGLEVTGIYSIWFHFSFVVGALSYFIWSHITIWIFAVPLILSRIPWGAFEITKTQIFGMYTKEQEREAVVFVESSLTHLLTMLSFGLGIIISDPSQFLWLVVGSLVFSLISAICYTVWARRSILLNKLMRRVNDFII